jgi:bacterioferritin-associated ferredoxin
MAIEMKVCSKCKVKKPLTEYPKRGGNNGYRADCKKCRNLFVSRYNQIPGKKKGPYKNWSKEDKEKIKQKQKEWKANNNEILCSICNISKPFSEFHKDISKSKGYSTQCKKCKNELKSIWGQNNPEKVKERRKKAYQKNKEFEKEKSKRWRKANPEWAKESKDKWKKENIEHVRKYRNKYQNKRRENDPLYKLVRSCRNRVSQSLNRRGYTKKSKTYKILGCSYEMFIKYLETQFSEGMSIDNYGEWELDHIIPISAADNEEEAIALNCYKNFQPLWKKENLLKADKFKTKDKEVYLEWYSKNITKD